MVHVEGEMSGPDASSERVEEEEDDEAWLQRYRLKPTVEGKPYSLAMRRSMLPMVG